MHVIYRKYLNYATYFIFAKTIISASAFRLTCEELYLAKHVV